MIACLGPGLPDGTLRHVSAKYVSLLAMWCEEAYIRASRLGIPLPTTEWMPRLRYGRLSHTTAAWDGPRSQSACRVLGKDQRLLTIPMMTTHTYESFWPFFAIKPLSSDSCRLHVHRTGVSTEPFDHRNTVAISLRYILPRYESTKCQS